MCVEDNGPGVESALRPKVFEAFVTSREGAKEQGLGCICVDDSCMNVGATLR